MSEAVTVALIAAVPPTIAALSAMFISSRNYKQLKGNGKGTHTQMLERLEDNMEILTNKVDSHVDDDRHRFDQIFQSFEMIGDEMKYLVRMVHRHDE